MLRHKMVCLNHLESIAPITAVSKIIEKEVETPIDLFTVKNITITFSKKIIYCTIFGGSKEIIFHKLISNRDDCAGIKYYKTLFSYDFKIPITCVCTILETGETKWDISCEK